MHVYRQGYDTRSLIAVELFLFRNRVFLKSTPAILVFEAVDHLRNRVLHVGDVCGLVVDVGLVELDLEFGDKAIYLCSPGVEVGEVSGVCILRLVDLLLLGPFVGPGFEVCVFEGGLGDLSCVLCAFFFKTIGSYIVPRIVLLISLSDWSAILDEAEGAIRLSQIGQKCIACVLLERQLSLNKSVGVKLGKHSVG